MKQPAFLKKPLDQMSPTEWESLCDGCGLCCQFRVEDPESGAMALSNVSCRYLCHESHRCTTYATRQKKVADCIKVTPENVESLHWLPVTCGYRLAANGEKLPGWHHLICGDKNRVHTHGPSMKGSIISEDDADWE